MEFEIPKNKREYEALSFDEKQIITYLFSKRAIQVVQELQAFSFGVSPVFKKEFDQKKIDDIFRVLSYTPMKAFFVDVKEEYMKALSTASTKIKAIKGAIVLLTVTALLTFTGVIDILKIGGG